MDVDEFADAHSVSITKNPEHNTFRQHRHKKGS